MSNATLPETTMTQLSDGLKNKSAKRNSDTNLATNLVTEHQEQVAFVEYCNWKANSDERYKFIYAIPNGGLRDKITAARLKKEGVKAGVLVICVPYLMFGYEEGIRTIVFCGAYIEFKKRGVGRLSPEQKEWVQYLRKANYVVLEKADATSAIAFIDDWFSIS